MTTRSRETRSSSTRCALHVNLRSQIENAPQMTGAAGSRFDLAVAKAPYEKDVFEAFLITGTLDDLREMSKQVKRRRHALLNVMLEDDDPTVYPESESPLWKSLRDALLSQTTWCRRYCCARRTRVSRRR